MARAADAIVGTGQGDGTVDGRAGIVGGEAESLTGFVVDKVVQPCPAASALGVGSIEAELDGLAEGTCGGVEPVGLALGRTKQFDDYGFRAVHKRVTAQMF